MEFQLLGSNLVGPRMKKKNLTPGDLGRHNFSNNLPLELKPIAFMSNITS